MARNDLFTVAILAYQNLPRVYHAIDSVLIQSEQAIELIIALPESFAPSEKEILKYIDTHKNDNVLSCKVFVAQPGATLTHMMNAVLPLCSGTFLMYLNGEDELYSRQILQTYRENFEKEPEETVVLTSQSLVYDRNSNQFLCYHYPAMLREIMENKDMRHLEEELLKDFMSLVLINACYRRSLFDSVAPFDERFAVIPDAAFLRSLVQAEKCVKYCNFVSIWHSAGENNRNAIYDTSGKRFALRERDYILLLQQNEPQLKQKVRNEPKNSVWRYARQKNRFWQRELIKREMFATGTKGKLRYYGIHPIKLLDKVSQKLFPHLKKVYTGFLGISGFALLCWKPYSAMLVQAFSFGQEKAEAVFLFVATVCLLLSGITFLFYIILKFLFSLDKAPKDTINFYG